nr:heat shock 70 kDa protein 15-like [Tanacetum cinerariifolium]
IVSVDSEQLIKEEELKVPVTKEPKKEATKMDSDDASAEVVTVEWAYIYYETRRFIDAPKHTNLIRLCLTSGKCTDTEHHQETLLKKYHIQS